MRRFNIVKMAIDLIAIAIKISGAFFAEVMFLKFTWKCKGPRIAKTISKKKNKFKGLTPLDFKN